MVTRSLIRQAIIPTSGSGGPAISGTVATYADLPAAASNEDALYAVTTASGVIFVNRRAAGVYRSDGSTWIYVADLTEHDDADEIATDQGSWTDVSGANVQAALDSIDDVLAATYNQSEIDAQMANKQDLDATLTALAALDSSAGMIAQTGADTFAKRTLAGTSNEITVTDGDGASGAPTFSLASNAKASQFVVTFDGQGSEIADNTNWVGQVNFAGTITEAVLLADQSGSIVVDVQKDSYANYPPTGADSICASAKPTISSATKSQDSTLTGWTTSFSAGDIFRFNVDSCTTITKATLILKVTR